MPSDYPAIATEEPPKKKAAPAAPGGKDEERRCDAVLWLSSSRLGASPRHMESCTVFKGNPGDSSPWQFRHCGQATCAPAYNLALDLRKRNGKHRTLLIKEDPRLKQTTKEWTAPDL